MSDCGLGKICSEVNICKRCLLWRDRINPVCGDGPVNAPVMFIGEAPGSTEDKMGKPFVGSSGKLLMDAILDLGVQRENVYITNVVKCRPPRNREPEPDEVESCWKYLVGEIDIIKPKVICCLGRVAGNKLLRTGSLSLWKLRETSALFMDIPVIITYHPAGILRWRAYTQAFKDDIKKVLQLGGLIG